MVYRNLIACFAVALSVMSVMGGERLPDGVNYTEKVGDYTWTFKIENGEATIGRFDEWGNVQWERGVDPEPEGELFVPGELGGNPVVSLGCHALADCQHVKSVRMQDSVRLIEYGCFDGCTALQDVQLSVAITNVGDYAFQSCYALESIVLPIALERIGASAFRGCGIRRIEIPASVSVIENGAFIGGCEVSVAEGNQNFAACDGALYDVKFETILHWPTSRKIQILNGLKRIGSYAYAYNSSSQGEVLELPSSVVEVGNDAFSSCGLTDVILNEGLETIGAWAFSYNDFRLVTVPSTLRRFSGDSFSSCRRLKAIYFSGDAPIDCSGFYNASSNLVLYVKSNSRGWSGNDDSEIPSRWPDSCDIEYSREIRIWTDFPQTGTFPLVTFDIGSRIQPLDWNWEPLSQVVDYGGSAVEPALSVPESVEFFGWDKDFSNVTSDIVVRAQYRMIDNSSMQFAVRQGAIEWSANISASGELWITGVNGPVDGILVVPELLEGMRIAGFSEGVFSGCSGLYEVVLPDSISNIDSAFARCSQLKNIALSSTNPNYRFTDGCLIDVNMKLCWCVEDRVELVIPDGVLGIGSGVYSRNAVVEKIVLPSSVTYYEAGAFCSCPNLKDVVIADGSRCFKFEGGVLCYWDGGVVRAAVLGVRNASVISIPDDTTQILGNAFEGNTNLTSITIPALVADIGYDVFNGCSNLKSVYFEGNAPWSYGIFYGTPADLIAYVREGSRGWAGEWSFELPEYWPNNQDSYWGRPVCRWEGSEPIRYTVRFDVGKYGQRTGGGELVQQIIGGKAAVLPIVEAGTGLTFEGWDADAGCVMSDVAVKAKYKRIGALEDGFNYTEKVGDYTWAFKIENGDATIGCFDEWGNARGYQRAVEPDPQGEVVIPSELGGCPVVAIGAFGLYGCWNVSAVTLPKGLMSIGVSAFESSGLQFVALPNGLESIGTSAFRYTQLSSVVIPDSVASIGVGAFVNSVDNGVWIEVTDSNERYCSDQGALFDKDKTTLYSWPHNRKIDVPEGIEVVADYACSGNHSREGEIIVLPTSVRKIGGSAFLGCGVKEIVLNEGLETIGEYAFSNNSNLRTMMIPASVKRIECGLFSWCQRLRSVCFKGNAPELYYDYGAVSRDPIYVGTTEVSTYVCEGTLGWGDVPGRWPMQYFDPYWIEAARPIEYWTDYPIVPIKWDVTFDLYPFGRRTGGGELHQRVQEGEAALPPKFEVAEGVRFAGWNCDFSCVTSQLTVVAKFVDLNGDKMPFRVNGRGSDENDGLTDETAFLTIQHAIERARDGDVIEVDDGVYGPIRVSDGDKHLLICSKHGASLTTIDGGGISRCATLGLSTNVAIQGFTFSNGYASWNENAGGGVYGGMLINCVVTNCVVDFIGDALGGGAYGSVLVNCLLEKNIARAAMSAYGGGATDCKMYNCTIVNNCVESEIGDAYGGGCCWGEAYNTIVWNNSGAAYAWSEDMHGTPDHMCFSGLYGDPMFIDEENGDYRLSSASPCVDTGCNDWVWCESDLTGHDRVLNGIVDMGAFEGGVEVPPSVPEDLSATEEKAGFIELSWSASRFAEGYVIYRANRNSFAKASQIATTAEAAYEDYDVNSDYTYYYWICATNAYAQSEMSDSVSGTCTDPISVLTTDEDLSGAVEMEPFSIQLLANGGVSPYVWTGTLPGYYIERTSSSFTECGKPRGFRKMSVEADYVLPFDFVLADGRASPYVHFSSDGWLEIRSNSTLWDYETLASFDLSGGNWLVATESTDDVYVDEGNDVVTFRWQRKFGDDVSLAANFSISLCRDGRVVAKYGNGNDLIGTMQYSIGDDCWGEVEVSGFCDDIVLMPIGMPPGLELADDGMLSGTPLKSGAYQFVVQAEGETGGTGYKWLTINIAENANKRPLVSGAPDTATVKVMVGEGKTFSVVAQDPEGGELTYRWLVDGEEIDKDTSTFRFDPTLEDDMRHHTIECWVSDDLWQDDNATRVKWEVDVFRTLRVDIERGLAFPEDEESPEPDGSGERPYKYLEDAMCYAGYGDVIEVGPGSHRLSWVNEGVLVKSTTGRAVTFIESEWGESVGGDRYSGSAIEGFTFVNYVVEGLVIRDSIVRGVKSDWGYAVSDCELIDCIVCGNVCDDYVVQYSKLTNCTVADNKSVNDGGIIGCDVSNSIVWNNQGQDGNVVNYYEPEDAYDYDGLCIFENSCVWPIQEGGGNTQTDPLFVDSFWHDYRLRVGSSAVGMGAGFLDHDVTGFVLSARIEGNGDVEPHTVVVSPNGSASFAVASSTRPLVCFSVGESNYEGAQSVTINDIQNDGIITAVFSNYTFYVDATNGDDSNDGLSKEKAFTSIQPALDRALNGEKIVVGAGVYAPITGFGRKVEVVAVDGAEKTIIDASMSCNSGSCANLGSRERASNEPGAYGDWYGTNTVLRGFTLTAGFDLLGGGAIGGTLEDCIIRGNVATIYGGGVFASVCRRCLIVDNRVEYDGNYYLVMEQYLRQMEKWRYRKHKGEYDPGDWDYEYFVGGGGAFGAELYNCTVVNNDILGDDVALYGYGALHCHSDHTIIICNYGEDCEFPIANVECVLAEDDDPMFADPDNGDFRLRCDSPYVVNGVATVGCYPLPYFDLPSVPLNVGATEDEPCQIVISWDAAEFAEAYLVYRATKNSFAKSECIAEVSDCFFIDRPADIIPEYYYWVQGKNLGGVGEVSDVALGWCDIEVEPEAVVNPVFEPSSEYYSDFCQWAVMNGVVDATGTNYAGQVRSAAVGLDAKGKPIWQDYIAGTSVSDPDSVFTAKIEFVDGKVKVTWDPRLTSDKESMRVYKTYRKTSLVENDWALIATSPDQVFDVSDVMSGFFKVEVDMKH